MKIDEKALAIITGNAKFCGADRLMIRGIIEAYESARPASQQAVDVEALLIGIEEIAHTEVFHGSGAQRSVAMHKLIPLLRQHFAKAACTIMGDASTLSDTKAERPEQRLNTTSPTKQPAIEPAPKCPIHKRHLEFGCVSCHESAAVDDLKAVEPAGTVEVTNGDR